MCTDMIVYVAVIVYTLYVALYCIVSVHLCVCVCAPKITRTAGACAVRYTACEPDLFDL